MITLFESAPTLDLSGSSTPPTDMIPTLNETGGGDGDKFWKIVNGPAGLGPLVLGALVRQEGWKSD